MAQIYTPFGTYQNLFSLTNTQSMNKLVTIFSILFLISACSKPAEETATTEAPTNQITLKAEQIKSFGIEMGNFETKTLHEYVRVNGSVEAPPQNMASVSFPIAGFIKTVAVRVGQSVQKGQTLAVIESMELVQLQQDYQQTISKLQFQVQELQRQKTLDNEDVGMKRKLQQAEAEFSGTKSLQNALETKLRMVGISPDVSKIVAGIRVVAPISGFVNMVNTNIGKAVSPTTVLFEIVSQQQSYLLLKVFEKDAAKIKIGQKLMIENSGQVIDGQVSLINKSFDAATRSLEVFGRVNGSSQLILGQYSTAKIDVGSRAVQTLPESAIVRKGETAYIFVETKPSHFERFLVNVGTQENGYIEATLTQKTTSPKIVTKGAKLLEAELMKGVGEEE